MRMILLATTLVALPAAAMAEPMSYQDAVAKAAIDGPSLEADRLEIEARRAAAPTADELPDPRLGVSVENFPISGPPAFSLAEDDMTMAVLGLSQEVPSSAKRRARFGRAAADIAEAEAVRSLSVLEVRIAAGVAWVDLAFAQQRLGAVDDAIDRVSAYRDTGAAGVASGTVRPAQTIETKRVIAHLEDMRAEILADRGRARAVLARWTNDPQPAAVGPLPHLEIDADRLRNDLGGLPQLGLAEARLQQARSEVALATSEKQPDWMFDVAYQKRAEQHGDMVTAGVTVSLPLFSGRRQDPLIASRLTASEAAAARLEDVRRSLAAELEASLADHDMHHDQWQRARDTLLPLAQQQADLEVASYAAGRASVQDVVAARTAAVEAELLVLEREGDVTRDAVRINLTFGEQADGPH